jgi:hypothetical protein
MEPEIKMRCLPEDNDLVESVLAEAEKEYSEFMKQDTGVDRKVKIELVKTVPLTDAETK